MIFFFSFSISCFSSSSSAMRANREYATLPDLIADIICFLRQNPYYLYNLIEEKNCEDDWSCSTNKNGDSINVLTPKLGATVTFFDRVTSMMKTHRCLVRYFCVYFAPYLSVFPVRFLLIRRLWLTGERVHNLSHQLCEKRSRKNVRNSLLPL